MTDDHRSGADAPGQTVLIDSGGLATSSTSVRKWSLGNRRMHHILDPRDGLPVRSGLAHRQRRRGQLRGGEHRLNRGDRARRRRDPLARPSTSCPRGWLTHTGPRSSSAAGRGDPGTERILVSHARDRRGRPDPAHPERGRRGGGVRPGQVRALAAVCDRRHPPNRIAARARVPRSSTSPPRCSTASPRSGCVDAVIPFAGSYRPLWLGLGAAAFDLLLAVIITSLVRARLGYRSWRAVHWLAYLAWPVALVHGLGTGSDVRLGWMLAVNVLCTAVVLIAVVARTLIGWPERLRLRLGALGAARRVRARAAGVGSRQARSGPTGPVAPGHHPRCWRHTLQTRGVRDDARRGCCSESSERQSPTSSTPGCTGSCLGRPTTAR